VRGRALAGTLAAVLLALAAPIPAGAGSLPRLTRPVRITTGDTTPTRTYSSPAIAIDPENEDNVVAAYAEMRTARCGLARSRDGGRTWTRVRSSPALASYPFCFTPASTNVHQAQLAFGRNHVLYLALPGWDVQDGRSFSVLLARSADLGETWSTTLVRDARGREAEPESNRPVASIAVDPRGPEDVVYVGWTWGQPVPPAPTRAPVPAVAVSTDGGRTFSEPIDLTAGLFHDEERRRAAISGQPEVMPPGFPPPTPRDAITAQHLGGLNPAVVLDRRGTVYALWSIASVNVLPGFMRSFYLSRSTDQARSFTVRQVVPPSPTMGNPALSWSPAGGTDGTLHLVYEDKRPPVQGDRDIVYQRSLDGGETWSAPVTLNDDDPAGLAAQFMPSLSVAPDGRVDVAWWDFRNDTGAFLNDVYLASSADNGATWGPNIRVSDRAIDRKIGPWSNGFDVRQPVGLAATRRYTLAAWDDTRNGDLDGQAQDLVAAYIQFRPLPPGTPPVLVFGFAAVVGLMLAGTVVWAVALRSRRPGRRGPDRTEAANPAVMASPST
jgi:hypothetical protein